MTDSQFREYYHIPEEGFGDEQNCNALSSGPVPVFGEDKDIPDTLDWREYNAVTQVRDQGSCGSCWTFSTVACLESHTLIKYNKTQDYAEQQLLDCAAENNNDGCQGGLPSHAFQYINFRTIGTYRLNHLFGVIMQLTPQQNQTGNARSVPVPGQHHLLLP